MLDCPEVGIRLVLGGERGWKRASIWEKKHIGECCVHIMSAELYTEQIEIPLAHSLARNRSWFHQLKGAAASCGFICASPSVSAGLRGPWCQSPVMPVPPSLVPLPQSADSIASRNCPNFLALTGLFLTGVILPVHPQKQLWLCRSGQGGWRPSVLLVGKRL